MRISKSSLIALLSITLFAFTPLSQAADKASITPVSSGDSQFLAKQIKSINDLSTQKLGRKLRGNSSADLETLQLLLDKNIVTKDQELQLQAMGAVLGDLYIRDLGVHWVSYTDQKGSSRALQWIDSEHVLFPITMISRRAKVGLKVDIKKLYDKGQTVLHRVIKDKNRRQILNIN